MNELSESEMSKLIFFEEVGQSYLLANDFWSEVNNYSRLSA